ncbi:MAG: hydrogenase expression/formation protein HypE [Candidatus Obscuribacterales bacterium]|nr:hydrogenase expression/formation protein HypE [Candidatus Obscuribacterales bacterium]
MSPPDNTSSICRSTKITMSHGSGGKDMRDLIEDIFVTGFANEELSILEDQARLNLADISAKGDRLAFTTDSYVVDPLFFPGGNIGSLAVNGTINDLAVGGAIPLYLSCGMIMEEGFPVEDLREIVKSMKLAADEAGVKIVTGDTKVVERNSADKIFINTSGIGIIPAGINIASMNARPGDLVLVNGFLGDHGAAIVGARQDLALENDIKSDCRSLNKLISEMLEVCPEIRCMRDATRGGIASVLNEIAEASKVCIRIKEKYLPIQEEVRAVCEILGLDPLYLANEGKLLTVVPSEYAEKILETMKNNDAGRQAEIIGEITAAPESAVILHTTFGGQRMIDKLVGEQLPRIC